MEVVQIIHENPWGENNHQTSPVFLAALDNQSITPQYYFLDTDGSVLPILDGDKIAFVAPEQEDEIPSWKLDHMYAKRREPGTEQPKPAKRRSKKKEVLTSQFFVQEMIEDPPPKINIIRQRHSVNSSYGFSRPKILSSPQSKFYASNNNTSCSGTNSMFSHSSASIKSSGMSSLNPHHQHNQRKVTRDESTLHSTFSDDFNAPSPAAVVTVNNNGVELDNLSNISVSSRSQQKSSFKKSVFPMSLTNTMHPQQHQPNLHQHQQLPGHIENRSTSLDSIEPDDDPELFFDFPMEEEEEGGVSLDVDFNEIPMNTTGSKDETVTLNFFHNSNSSSSCDHNNLNNTSIRCNSDSVHDDHEMTDDPSLLDNFMMSETTPLLPHWDSSPINSSSLVGHCNSNNNDSNISNNNSCITVENNNNNNISLSNTTNTTTATTTEIVKRKRGRPFKNKPGTDSSSPAFSSSTNGTKKSPRENIESRHNSAAAPVTPTRKSGRPVKPPSRLEDMEDTPTRRKGSNSWR